jgi:hypothetical protein
MPEYDDVFTAFEEHGTFAPQIRIYLLSEEHPPVTRLSAALPDYDVVLPHSTSEIALIRKIAIESEQHFRAECNRVAAVLAALLIPESHLSCVYDDAGASTRFLMELRKDCGGRAFIEIDRAAESGR